MPLKGHHPSPETIEKMRVAQRGRKRGPHSPETRARISAAQLGRSQSPEHTEKSRLARIGLPGSRKGAILSDETKQKIRDARALQVHPGLAARGITLEMEAAAIAAGLRWCSGACKAFVPEDKFYGKSSKIGACGECTKSGVYSGKKNWTPERKADNEAYLSKYRISRSESVRKHWLNKKYGVTPKWYDEKLAEQDGHCALCDATLDERKLPACAIVEHRKYLLVDHSHETGKARGLLCAKCNTALHRVEYIDDWAGRAIRYLARYAPS